MKIIKCGGSVLKNLENRKKIYKEIKDYNDKVILIVSAFIDCPYSTKSLSELIKLNYSFQMKEELLVIGEIISSIRVTNELLNEYVDAELLYKEEIGIHVVSSDKMEYIDHLDNTILLKKIKEHKVIVVPGFIGINQDNKIVSLNKNGSDLTAIAIAKMCNANEVYLYKDVLGLSSIDPIYTNNIKVFKTVSYDMLLQIVLHGNDIVQADAIKFAKENDINIIITHYINHSYNTLVSKYSKEKVVVFQKYKDDIYIEGITNMQEIANHLIFLNIPYEYILPCNSYIKIVTKSKNQNIIINQLHNLYLKGEL